VCVYTHTHTHTHTHGVEREREREKETVTSEGSEHGGEGHGLNFLIDNGCEPEIIQVHQHIVLLHFLMQPALRPLCVCLCVCVCV
jgi:hypothetical protein